MSTSLFPGICTERSIMDPKLQNNDYPSNQTYHHHHSLSTFIPIHPKHCQVIVNLINQSLRRALAPISYWDLASSSSRQNSLPHNAFARNELPRTITEPPWHLGTSRTIQAGLRLSAKLKTMPDLLRFAARQKIGRWFDIGGRISWIEAFRWLFSRFPTTWNFWTGQRPSLNG